VRPYA